MQILIEDAKEIDPEIEVGERIEKEVTPADFGRVAAGTAKQVIMQKIREAEKARRAKRKRQRTQQRKVLVII